MDGEDGAFVAVCGDGTGDDCGVDVPCGGGAAVVWAGERGGAVGDDGGFVDAVDAVFWAAGGEGLSGRDDVGGVLWGGGDGAWVADSALDAGGFAFGFEHHAGGVAEAKDASEDTFEDFGFRRSASVAEVFDHGVLKDGPGFGAGLTSFVGDCAPDDTTVGVAAVAFDEAAAFEAAYEAGETASGVDNLAGKVGHAHGAAVSVFEGDEDIIFIEGDDS